jgi:UDP:flavonoid glycosyltransferase YjiC (YdhE family)
VSRFLFLSLPLTGHVHPIAAVAQEAIGHGDDVAWAGSESFLRPHVGPHATVFGTPLRPYRGQGDLGMAAARSRWDGYVVPHARHTLTAVDRAVREYRPDVLVVDQHAVAGALVAHRHGLPWATLAPTSMELTLPYRTLPRVEAWIAERLRALWHGAGLPGDPPHDLRFSPHLVVSFGSAALCRDPLPVPNVEFVGPAIGHRPPVPDVPAEWFDPHRRTVLVTVGTLAADHAADFLRRVVAAARPLDDVQLIVVAPPGSVGDAHERVVVVARVPMPDLLRRVDAVVTHGGLNTVCEALAAGVPLVVAPIKDDQPVNAAQVVAAGAGVRVRFFRSGPDELRAALRTVLDAPTCRDGARRVQRDMARAGGAAAAVGHLRRLAAYAVVEA